MQVWRKKIVAAIFRNKLPLIEKYNLRVSNQLTEKEQLEEACWNGLLPEMLPEIYGQTCGKRKLYLWQIREAASFIEIELGELPADKDKYFSIDPYSFLQLQSLS